MSESKEQRTDSAAEDLKGTAKKVAGMLTGKEHLEQEGEAQREKADAERDAAELREAADAREAEAIRRGAEQKLHEQRDD